MALKIILLEGVMCLRPSKHAEVT